MNHIVDGSNFREKDIGTKARNLFVMREQFPRVPNLFCLESGFFDEYLCSETNTIENALSQIDFSNPSVLESASETIRQSIAVLNENHSYRQTIERLTQDYLKHTQIIAVRSSAAVEDGAGASFAGQFASFVGIPADTAATCVTACIASLYEPNALVYCYEKGIPLSALRMNVIIQEWVEPALSGIMFTANPQGLLNEIVIVVGAGPGDHVVQDKVPTTTYYYNITDKEYYYETRENSPLLEDALITQLIDDANRFKSLFGEYLDIEYAVKDGEVHFLQVRPITALETGEQTILDNSNIVESYPNISLPLTDSFVREAYYRVFRGLASRCLKNDKLLKKYDPDLRNMVGSANGRMYYQISNWYAVLNFLPMSKKIIPIWQDMMGVAHKDHEEYKKELSLTQSVRTYINCIYEAFRVQKEMESLNNEFRDIVEHFRAGYNPGLSVAELRALYDAIAQRILSNWDITLLNDIYAFVFTGLLKNKLKKRKTDNYEALTNEYISGVANIESMKPVRALAELANHAVIGNHVADLKRLKNDAMAREYFYGGSAPFCVLCQDFIETYGDRSIEELKLESDTFRTSPLLLVKKLLEYSEDPTRLAAIIKSLTTESDFSKIKGSGNALDRHIIALYSKKAMRGISNRERSRLNRSRIYGIVRTLFLTIGAIFHEDGRLENERDIFYLSVQEVFGDDGKADFRELVAARKEEYAAYRKLPSYSRLVFNGPIFNKQHANINAEKTVSTFRGLTGIPCSNGIVEGEVLMVDSPQTATNTKDKILVTKMTDPGWVFLITTAKGIIAEKGSLLSHTAIISRELNVPSIVGVKNITKVLKNGDIVRMNGNNGKIELVRDANV